MPHPRVRLAPTDADIPEGVLQRCATGSPRCAPSSASRSTTRADALAEAEQVAAAPPDLPERDETALPFFTVDPPGSMDLDQAMHLERDGDGHRIRYAIADVPGLRAARRRARPGHPRARPDRLLPRRAGAAAPGGALRGGGEPAAGCRAPRLRVGPAARRRGRARRRREVHRAMVRSVERLDYAAVQAAVDAGTDDERFLLLREIGERRIAQERARGGASLPMPEQQVTRTRRRRLHPRVPPAGAGRGVERAGVAAHRHGRRRDDARRRGRRAAHHAGPDRPRRSTRFRRAARGLGAEWPDGRALRRVRPRRWTAPTRGTSPSSTRRRRCSAAPATRRSTASRPSSASTPPSPLRTPTSPRRCGGSSTASASSSARPRAAAPRCRMPCARRCRSSPELMRDSDRRARAAERACADATEAAVLHGREGRRSAPSSLDHTDKGMEVQLVDLPVSPGSPARVAAARGRRAGAARPRRRRGPVTVAVQPRRDADPYTGGGRVGRTVASVGNHRRGRSGLRRAGWWPTATRGDPRDSATENRPPPPVAGGGSKGETVV